MSDPVVKTEMINLDQVPVRINMDTPPAIPIPVPTGYSVLSLGAGVQSSALALMFARGIFEPMPDVAVFADTQAEPPSVYEWLTWLEAQLPFPVVKVTKGSLEELSVRIRTSKTGTIYQKDRIPAYIGGNGRPDGMETRQCTSNFKIDPIYRYVNGERGKGQRVVMSIGISWDEIRRMRDSSRKWIDNRYPLVERRITRDMCKRWMIQEGYPEPPRSACVFCPYHSNAEWHRLKTEEPDQFERAVEYERKLQETYRQVPRMHGIPYLHAARRPLDEIDFEHDDHGQGDLFGAECEGMCGI